MADELLYWSVEILSLEITEGEIKNGQCRDTRHIGHTRHRTKTKNTSEKHNTTLKTKNMSSRVPNKKHRRSRMISYFSICQLHDNVICNYLVRDDIVKHFLGSVNMNDILQKVQVVLKT